jgi:hypothetical protein
MFRHVNLFIFIVLIATSFSAKSNAWLLVDNFEESDKFVFWYRVDPDNQTAPKVASLQLTELRSESPNGNVYMLKKPAAEGVVGNRKALSSRALPVAVGVGETFTFYTRINVEYFPNNHAFGVSNKTLMEISELDYNAFEPMIRITDKAESDGSQNTGVLMVSSGFKQYANIIDPATGKSASPLQTDTWYELWYVVNNAPAEQGGQRFDVYIRGGEFGRQQQVFVNAGFRMQRGEPLISFMAICNTGSAEKPYGNGGVRYDDIYMAPGLNLSTPQ